MNGQVFKGPNGLNEFAESCAEALLRSNPEQFNYPSATSLTQWPSGEIIKMNEQLLRRLNKRGNVYALFTRPGGSTGNWKPVYVGQRKSQSLRERIVQHLVKKNECTGSMLEAVKTAVSDGREVAISYVLVEPESLRLFVEETIIASNKAQLPWNTHG